MEGKVMPNVIGKHRESNTMVREDKQHGQSKLFKNKVLTSALFAIVLIMYCKSVQALEYDEYHRRINFANKLMFIENNIQGGLKQYDTVFMKFDFSFASDCLTAIQMALYAESNDYFLSFCKKGFSNGISLQFLKSLPYVKNHPIYHGDSNILKTIYFENRKRYLSRIDTNVLKTVYRLYVRDQLAKAPIKGIKESVKEWSNRYFPVLEKISDTIFALSKQGIPMDKRIGVSQANIMKELDVKYPDLLDHYSSGLRNFPFPSDISESQFTTDDALLYSQFYLVILIHKQNLLRRFEDSAILRREIIAGNIHPKDIGFLFDNFNGYNTVFQSTPRISDQQIKITGYYGVGIRSDTNANSLMIPDSQINRFRLAYFLPEIEVDRAKWKFMRKMGMKYGYGFVGIRS
jgi:hypothetical protein